MKTIKHAAESKKIEELRADYENVIKNQKERILLEGELPTPLNPPPGCPFVTRCPYATEVCKHVPPEYREVEPGHFAACHLLEQK